MINQGGSAWRVWKGIERKWKEMKGDEKKRKELKGNKGNL